MLAHHNRQHDDGDSSQRLHRHRSNGYHRAFQEEPERRPPPRSELRRNGDSFHSISEKWDRGTRNSGFSRSRSRRYYEGDGQVYDDEVERNHKKRRMSYSNSRNPVMRRRPYPPATDRPKMFRSSSSWSSSSPSKFSERNKSQVARGRGRYEPESGWSSRRESIRGGRYRNENHVRSENVDESSLNTFRSTTGSDEVECDLGNSFGDYISANGSLNTKAAEAPISDQKSSIFERNKVEHNMHLTNHYRSSNKAVEASQADSKEDSNEIYVRRKNFAMDRDFRETGSVLLSTSSALINNVSSTVDIESNSLPSQKPPQSVDREPNYYFDTCTNPIGEREGSDSNDLSKEVDAVIIEATQGCYQIQPTTAGSSSKTYGGCVSSIRTVTAPDEKSSSNVDHKQGVDMESSGGAGATSYPMSMKEKPANSKVLPPISVKSPSHSATTSAANGVSTQLSPAAILNTIPSSYFSCVAAERLLSGVEPMGETVKSNKSIFTKDEGFSKCQSYGDNTPCVPDEPEIDCDDSDKCTPLKHNEAKADLNANVAHPPEFSTDDSPRTLIDIKKAKRLQKRRPQRVKCSDDSGVENILKIKATNGLNDGNDTTPPLSPSSSVCTSSPSVRDVPALLTNALSSTSSSISRHKEPSDMQVLPVPLAKATPIVASLHASRPFPGTNVSSVKDVPSLNDCTSLSGMKGKPCVLPFLRATLDKRIPEEDYRQSPKVLSKKERKQTQASAKFLFLEPPTIPSQVLSKSAPSKKSVAPQKPEATTETSKKVQQLAALREAKKRRIEELKRKLTQSKERESSYYENEKFQSQQQAAQLKKVDNTTNMRSKTLSRGIGKSNKIRKEKVFRNDADDDYDGDWIVRDGDNSQSFDDDDGGSSSSDDSDHEIRRKKTNRLRKVDTKGRRLSDGEHTRKKKEKKTKGGSRSSRRSANSSQTASLISASELKDLELESTATDRRRQAQAHALNVDFDPDCIADPDRCFGEDGNLLPDKKVVDSSSLPKTESALKSEPAPTAMDTSGWVRRSARMPQRTALHSPRFLELLEKLRNNCNDIDIQVLKLKEYLPGMDAPSFALDAVLDALDVNTTVQSLYIQNYNAGMRDAQVMQLLRVLKRGNIWCLNLGETYQVRSKTWRKFARGLKETHLTHYYMSEHIIDTELKDEIRATIRANRDKEPRRHIDPNNLDVIERCTHCWWNPINAKVLRPYIKAAGKMYLLSAAAQNAPLLGVDKLTPKREAGSDAGSSNVDHQQLSQQEVVGFVKAVSRPGDGEDEEFEWDG